MENTKINLETQKSDVLNKTCRKCGEEKPATLEYFFKNSGGKFGLTPRCKPCVNEDNKKWADNNKERVLANANARQKKYYNKDIEASRHRHRISSAKIRATPEKNEVIKARKRAGGAKLSPEEIQIIRDRQNDLCAICQKPHPNDLDHCHKTGKIRWLLCKHCNRGLGAFFDDPSLLRKAADMLEAHKIGFSTSKKPDNSFLGSINIRNQRKDYQ